MANGQEDSRLCETQALPQRLRVVSAGKPLFVGMNDEN